MDRTTTSILPHFSPKDSSLLHDQNMSSRPHSMFGSIKRKLTPKTSNNTNDTSSPTSPNTLAPTSNTPPPQSEYQYMATRRPAAPPQYDGPPPAYTAPAPAPISAPAPAPAPVPAQPIPSEDSKYAFLRDFDTVLLLDDSGSMAGSRWSELQLALESILEVILKWDTDGIDIHFLNHIADSVENVTSPAVVRELFHKVRPGSRTPTGTRLRQLILPYIQSLEAYEALPAATRAARPAPKPMNIICITDGAPNDDPESTILEAARRLDRLGAPAWQLGIQFFQIGSDPEATEHLQDMDDELTKRKGNEGLRDIVDTVPFSDVGGQASSRLQSDAILKVVLGAVNRRLDRKKV